MNASQLHILLVPLHLIVKMRTFLDERGIKKKQDYEVIT